MTILECEIEDYLVKRVNGLMGECWKFVSPNRAGVPDRIVMLPGARVWFVELKSKSGSVNPLQAYVHRLLGDQGHKVEIISSKKEVDEFIKRITAK